MKLVPRGNLRRTFKKISVINQKSSEKRIRWGDVVVRCVAFGASRKATTLHVEANATTLHVEAPNGGRKAPKGSKRVGKMVGIITIRFVCEIFVFWSPDDKRRGIIQVFTMVHTHARERAKFSIRLS